MENIISVILAAGAGTRMKSSKAKVVHEISGKMMLQWVLDASNKAGASQTIVVVGHQAEQIRDSIAKTVSFVVQEQRLGTGHAVMQAEELLSELKGTVMILCGDTPLITSETLQKAYLFHKQGNFSATVITAFFDNPFGYGRIVRDANGNVIRIVEQKDATDEEKKVAEINSGMYCFEIKDLLLSLKQLNNNNSQGEYYLTDTIEILIGHGKMIGAYMVEDSREIMGVNNRVQMAEAGSVIQKRINENHMMQGVTIIDPSNTYIGAEVEIGRDTVVYPGTIIEGDTKVGENCVLGPQTRIVGSVIGDKVQVVNSVVLESFIGNQTKVGPFAYLRPGSRIGKDVKIGDFVEIKKSVIGDKTKISHLSYVGDAEVGENVNIGCGVVVVNYDGRKKNKTIIGDNVFVGCNTNLVSPVEVKQDSYIAAGSTITEDVPEYALAIARSRQTIIQDWVKRKGIQRGK